MGPEKSVVMTIWFIISSKNLLKKARIYQERNKMGMLIYYRKRRAETIISHIPLVLRCITDEREWRIGNCFGGEWVVGWQSDRLFTKAKVLWEYRAQIYCTLRSRFSFIFSLIMKMLIASVLDIRFQKVSHSYFEGKSTVKSSESVWEQLHWK